jgi:hypothetical protein
MNNRGKQAGCIDTRTDYIVLVENVQIASFGARERFLFGNRVA